MNGNAYSLKLNIKYNTSLDNVGVENSINDFTTFSMDLFFDTTSVLENATKLLMQANDRYAGILDRLNVMENMVLSSEDAQEMSAQIASLQTQVENASLNYADEASLLDMITEINRRVNSIVNGTIPTEVQYNTNVVFAGPGIEVDKSTANKIKINNINKGYQFPTLFQWDNNTSAVGVKIDAFDPNTADQYGMYVRLKDFSNMLRVITTSTTAIEDVNIYIDDSTNGWSNGQIFRVALDNITINGNNIKIWTSTSTGYDQAVANIDPSQLITTTPYIEIVCMDSSNYVFEADILR